MSQEESEVTCPLCFTPATFTYISRKDRKRFSCPTCVHSFLIARRAENVLRADFSKNARPEFSEKVQSTPDGKIAEIYCPPKPANDPSEEYVVLDFIGDGADSD